VAQLNQLDLRLTEAGRMIAVLDAAYYATASAALAESKAHGRAPSPLLGGSGRAVSARGGVLLCDALLAGEVKLMQRRARQLQAAWPRLLGAALESTSIEAMRVACGGGVRGSLRGREGLFLKAGASSEVAGILQRSPGRPCNAPCSACARLH
jgi:hypothetical protein